MNRSFSPLSVWISRLIWVWAQRFGWPALAALAMVVAAGLLYFQWTPRLQRERVLLAQHQAARSAAAALTRSRGPTDAQEGARLFVESLPLSHGRSKDIGKILEAARDSKLTIERADYSVQREPNAPITQMRAVIPVKGSYADIRQLITRVLNSVPHAALESLQLERPSATTGQLDAVLQFTLLYRTEQP